MTLFYKLSGIVSCALVAGLLLTSCWEDKGSKAKSGSVTKDFNVATAADYAPFTFLKDGKPQGFDIELLNELCKRLGYQPKIEDVPFQKLLDLKGKDAAIGALSPTEERKKRVDFSLPYHKTSAVLLLGKMASSIKSPKDLSGKKLGVQKNSIHEIQANEWKRDIKLDIFSESLLADLVNKLKSGQFQAIAVDKTTAEDLMKNNPELAMADLPNTGTEYAMAFSKGSSFKKDIDKEIEKMEKDGSLAKLRDKWLSGGKKEAPVADAQVQTSPDAGSADNNEMASGEKPQTNKKLGEKTLPQPALSNEGVVPEGENANPEPGASENPGSTPLPDLSSVPTPEAMPEAEPGAMPAAEAGAMPGQLAPLPEESLAADPSMGKVPQKSKSKRKKHAKEAMPQSDAMPEMPSLPGDEQVPPEPVRKKKVG